MYKSGKRRGRLQALREISILTDLAANSTEAQMKRLPRIFDHGSFATLKYARGSKLP